MITSTSKTLATLRDENAMLRQNIAAMQAELDALREVATLADRYIKASRRTGEHYDYQIHGHYHDYRRAYEAYAAGYNQESD